MSVDVIQDNTYEVKEGIANAIDRALEKIGSLAERYAKEALTDQHAVDTGRLRDSVTHEVSNGEKAVYVGTNVEYAPYIELGTSRMKARPYLVPAASEHADQYRQVLETELRG